MKSIHKEDKRRVRHIGSRRFGVQFLLKGLYAHGDLLYFHTETRNRGNVPFDVDFVTFKIVDKKVIKRTAMQEQVIYPLRAYNYATRVDGGKAERTVFALPKFTIPDGKMLVVEMNEKQGGRHQRFEVQGEDVANADELLSEAKKPLTRCVCYDKIQAIVIDAAACRNGRQSGGATLPAGHEGCAVLGRYG